MPHIAPWFPDAKLGVFVHFGVFRTMLNEHEADHRDSPFISAEEYQARAGLFTMERFDMDRWADLFAESGAKNAVLTARHAMGFALWDTAVDDRLIATMSPYGKDLAALWCGALRERGLKVGLYFGHRDWGDKDFNTEMRPNAAEREPDGGNRQAAWER